LENLSTFAVQLARQEHLAEEQLRGGVRVAEVLRHLTGTLFTADSLTAEDAMGLLSEFRLCSSLELCHPLSNERFMKLLDQVQPATLLQDNPHCMSIRELDCCRASLLQNVLPLRADV
jgi:protein-arginine kinase